MSPLFDSSGKPIRMVMLGLDKVNREQAVNFQRQKQRQRFDGTIVVAFITPLIDNIGGLSSDKPLVSLNEAQPEDMMPSADSVRRLEEKMQQLMAGVRSWCCFKVYVNFVLYWLHCFHLVPS